MRAPILPSTQREGPGDHPLLGCSRVEPPEHGPWEPWAGGCEERRPRAPTVSPAKGLGLCIMKTKSLC